MENFYWEAFFDRMHWGMSERFQRKFETCKFCAFRKIQMQTMFPPKRTGFVKETYKNLSPGYKNLSGT